MTAPRREWHGPIVTVNICPHCHKTITAQFEAKVTQNTDHKTRADAAEARLGDANEVVDIERNLRREAEARLAEAEGLLKCAAYYLGDATSDRCGACTLPIHTCVNRSVTSNVSAKGHALSSRRRGTTMPSDCLWRENEDGQWETACGHAWEFTSGGPEENLCQFCMCCGRPLKVEAYHAK